MRYSRPKGLATASLVLSLLSLSGLVSAAPSPSLAEGTIVDQSGRPIPRARVHVLDATAPATLSDEAGRFAVEITGRADCGIEATLTGFEPATAPCASPSPLRLVLSVAPIAETVVVTATRTAAPAGQVGASVTAFTADDMDRRRVSLVSDLLRTTPGATVIQSAGPGGVTSLFVRGGENNYNKVLLDGIPLNEPGGTFNFADLTTDHLERVEIVRGAQSALFGSDASASVVQLFTKRAAPGDASPHVTLGLEGGGYGTASATASVSQAVGSGDYSLGVSRFQTDNRGANNAFDNTVLSGTAGIALGGSATLRLVGRGDFGRVGTPGQTAFGRADLDAFFDHKNAVGGVTFDQQLTPNFRQRASYSLSYSDQISTNLHEDPPYTPRFGSRVAPFEFDDFTYDSTTALHRHHASYQADARLPHAGGADQLLTVLADWDGERAVLTDRLASTLTHASRNNVGASVQHQALWSRVFLTVGARVEHNENFGTAATPRGSVAVVLRQADGSFGETTLRAGAGLGIKEPTILQSFSPSPFFKGNPDLEPERSRTAEVGIDQRFAKDRIRIEATWFDNRFRNLISTKTLSFNPYLSQYFNIGLTQARGAELAVEAAPHPWVHGRAGYTFLDSEILTSTSPGNVVFQQGAQLFRRPRHSGFLGVTVGGQRATLDLTGTFVGEYVDSDFSSLEPPIVKNPGYTRWDLRLSYAISARLKAIAALDNAGNADYMEALGYPALRRAARVGLRVSF